MSRHRPASRPNVLAKPSGSQSRVDSRNRGQDPTGSVIDPVWLLKALVVTISFALLCGYVSFCLLFYQGQWQLVLHPTRNRTELTRVADPSENGSPTPMIHFGPDASGTPQLTGWWIPAAAGGRYRHLTVLYLPSGDGQVATAQPVLADLHRLGLNVFTFDYRGFGQSAPGHPNQARMAEDARTALDYLSSTRQVPRNRMILYGAGVGGSLAVSLAQTDGAIPALVLDGPEPDLLAVALADPRARILPVRLLFKERFALYPALAGLHTPKLILTRNSSENARISGDAAGAAATPKMTVALPHATPELLTGAISRFLDQYAPPTPPADLVPTPAPAASIPR